MSPPSGIPRCGSAPRRTSGSPAAAASSRSSARLSTWEQVMLKEEGPGKHGWWMEGEKRRRDSPPLPLNCYGFLNDNFRNPTENIISCPESPQNRFRNRNRNWEVPSGRFMGGRTSYTTTPPRVWERGRGADAFGDSGGDAPRPWKARALPQKKICSGGFAGGGTHVPLALPPTPPRVWESERGADGSADSGWTPRIRGKRMRCRKKSPQWRICGRQDARTSRAPPDAAACLGARAECRRLRKFGEDTPRPSKARALPQKKIRSGGFAAPARLEAWAGCRWLRRRGGTHRVRGKRARCRQKNSAVADLQAAGGAYPECSPRRRRVSGNVGGLQTAQETGGVPPAAGDKASYNATSQVAAAACRRPWSLWEGIHSSFKTAPPFLAVMPGGKIKRTPSYEMAPGFEHNVVEVAGRDSLVLQDRASHPRELAEHQHKASRRSLQRKATDRDGHERLLRR
ncbi:hypothetical protein B0H19DRAFT_1079050 [Mycena capillaripes]|nr:hypothetical protein B0H19DRAFT_1079050 [Mycena capillaripes]